MIHKYLNECYMIKKKLFVSGYDHILLFLIFHTSLNLNIVTSENWSNFPFLRWTIFALRNPTQFRSRAYPSDLSFTIDQVGIHIVFPVIEYVFQVFRTFLYLFNPSLERVPIENPSFIQNAREVLRNRNARITPHVRANI